MCDMFQDYTQNIHGKEIDLLRVTVKVPGKRPPRAVALAGPSSVPPGSAHGVNGLCKELPVADGMSTGTRTDLDPDCLLFGFCLIWTQYSLSHDQCVLVHVKVWNTEEEDFMSCDFLSSVSSSTVSGSPLCSWRPLCCTVARRRERTSTLPILLVHKSSEYWYVCWGQTKEIPADRAMIAMCRYVCIQC